MTKIFLPFLLAGSICFLGQGCTYKAWYEGFKEDCYKYENSSERQECLERVNRMTYEEYKKDREDLIKKSE